MKMDTPATLGAPAQTDTSTLLQRRLQQETRGEVLFDIASRGRYATDASIYQMMPVGVFVPTCAEDVRIAIDIARDIKVPILPRGGGTSQCGQTVGAALVIDFSKHVRNVINVNVDERTATVEPGLVLDHLNASLKPQGLWYPVDVSTSAQATLGGMAGNNSCGSRSIAYGNMVHNVLGASMWLSDGDTIQFSHASTPSGHAASLAARIKAIADEHRDDIAAHFPRVLRRVGGYNLDIFYPQSERPYTQDGSANLAHLLVGAEGSLGVYQSLTLALSPLPRAKVLGVVNFPTFYQAMDAAQHIVKLAPTAVELVDRTMIELSRNNPAFRPVIETALIGEPDAILLVEFVGEDKTALSSQLRALDGLMGDLGLPRSVVRMVDDVPQKALWEVRKAGLNIMMSLKGDGKPVSFIEDCAVPLEHLAEYTDQLTHVFRKHGTRGTWYAHASVGTLHVRPILDMRRDGAAKMRAIAEEASALVRKYKGAYSGEHGDGICRGEWIEWQFGERLTHAFAQVKTVFDPINLMNPGKIVAPPKMDDASLFRFKPGYRSIEIKPAFDWSAWNVQNDPVTEETTAPGTGDDNSGGFAKAAEMCNNNGHCRKFDAGTMCPSYRVTRDEKHVTRGRANTLRLALSGQLGPDALTGDAVAEAMDLCVGCKGCKRDCPTGVDMAKMKLEYLHHAKQKHGYTLQDKLIAQLPDYAPWARRFAALLNLRNHIPLLAALAERVTGLSAKRALPAWRSKTFWQLPYRSDGAEQVIAAHRASGKAAVLFVDTFNGTFEDENALAALAVLHAAGYAVHVASKSNGTLCCGRTYLARGMTERAQAKAQELVTALLPFAQEGIAIVGLEPSCLLTLRDEYLAMNLGSAAQTVAARAVLFEEFIQHEVQAGRFTLTLKPADKPILVHGHCHQKAFGIASTVMETLKLIPGAKPEMIESSCCGMAGSFGYEREHHAVSMRMAELSLLPAIRNAPDALVVADGTSCRHQIKDGAERQALHVARVLEAHLLG